MPNIKYCNCSWGRNDRMKRIYIRVNKPLFTHSELKEMKMKQSYSRKFVGIGWICGSCNEITLDNN